MSKVRFIQFGILGGFAIAGVGYYMRFNVSDKFTKQTYYKNGLTLLEGYEPAWEKLGGPLKYGKVDISDEFNFHDETTARAKVPVTGKLRKADLFIYASRPDVKEKWNVDKLGNIIQGCITS